MESVGTQFTDEEGRRLLASWEAIKPVREIAGNWTEDVWLVGGAVRDLILGRTPREVDLLVAGDALGLAHLFSEAVPNSRLSVHERFRTASVTGADLNIDVAGARTETYDRPGALPAVRPTSVEADLARRDFSINAMAMRISGEDAGCLLDPHGGLADLRARLLCVLHDRSFHDDPTRLWRAARYQARLGFSFDESTSQLAVSAVAGGCTETVSPERHGGEFKRMLDEPQPSNGLAIAAELGLLEAIGARSPQLAAGQAASEILGPEADPRAIALVATWFGTSDAKKCAQRIGLHRTDSMLAAQAGRAEAIHSMIRQAQGDVEIDAAMRDIAVEVVAVITAALDCENGRIWLARLQDVVVAISGEDLLKAGVSEGPNIGVGLEAARRHVLQTGDTDAKELIDVALNAIEQMNDHD